MAFGITLSIGAYAMSDNKEIIKKDENYAGVTAYLESAREQDVFVDTAYVQKVALDNYYYEKWLNEVKAQFEELYRQSEEVRISYEGNSKIVNIPTTTWTLEPVIIDKPNPDFNPFLEESFENPTTIQEVVEIGQTVHYSGTKTYMDYRTITATSSPQYALEHISDDYYNTVEGIKASELTDEEKMAQISALPLPESHIYTDEKGFRRIKCKNPNNSDYTDRYVIAVGSGVTSKIGQYVDLQMSDGSVWPCIVGDQKSDLHTDKANHLMTAYGDHAKSACASEFVVEADKLPSIMQDKGDSSYALGLVGIRVDSIKVYNKNVLK